MKRWYALLALTAMLFVGGCREAPTEPAEEAEQVEEITSSLNEETSTNVASSSEAASTVCEAFRTQLRGVQAKLEDGSADARLEESKTTLEGIITHTCH